MTTLRLTLFANEATRAEPSFEYSLADLDSTTKPQRTGDQTEEEDEESDNGKPRVDSTRSAEPTLRHKPAYPPPPEDVDLGAGWNIEDVRAARAEDDFESEGDTDGHADLDNELEAGSDPNSHDSDQSDHLASSHPPHLSGDNDVNPYNTHDRLSRSESKPKMGTTETHMHYDQQLVSASIR